MLTAAMKAKIAECRAAGILPVMDMTSGELRFLEAKIQVTEWDANGRVKTVELWREPMVMTTPVVPLAEEPAQAAQTMRASGSVRARRS